MVILDKALAQREADGMPIRIGLIGAGFMGQAVALQLGRPVPGMRLVAIANRTLEHGQQAWTVAGQGAAIVVRTQKELDAAVSATRPVVTNDAVLVCRAAEIDVLIETTSDIEASAQIVLEAISARKHVVHMNAQLDATIGPLLKSKADAAGVVYSGCDGDEPAVAMNLICHVRTLGFQVMLAGNIKGFLDRYRTPETQREFAEKTGQRPEMVSAYADGTKLNMECCTLANAAGLHIARRGMIGPKCTHIKDISGHFLPEKLLEAPLVDYALGCEPPSGVFVVGYNKDLVTQRYMDYLKMGQGPFYVFYEPYILPTEEAMLSAARAVLFGDAAIAPRGAPVCEVVTVAKHDLNAGETLEGMGGFTSYGLIENAQVARRENLLPMGLSSGCRMRRDMKRDQAIGFDDVERPAPRLIDRLWDEQIDLFASVERDAAAPQSSSLSRTSTSTRAVPT